MTQIGEMTELCCKIIKNKNNQHDNPDLLWIIRDFDLKVNDANGYLEDQIKKNDQKIFNFFTNRHCRFLFPWNNMDNKYIDSINKLKSTIYTTLLRRKTLQGSFLNGEEFAEFVSLISKQINKTNVINYDNLSITYHNVAKENLKRIKSEITNKLKNLEEKLKKIPLKWDAFNENVSKLRDDSMNELKSKIKKDEEFQKEYIEDLSLFMDDKIYIANIFNRDQLEALHKGILDSLLNPLIEKLQKKSSNIDLENDLKELEDKYRRRGIESPQLEKIFNEKFIQISQVMRVFGMKVDIKNVKNIFISYAHADKVIVLKIFDKLKENFTVWIDEVNLIGGDDLYEKIAGGLRNSSLFICFISEQYCVSNNCKREIALADNLKKKILPVMLQREAKNGIELYIATLNTFYAFKKPNVFDPWSEDLYQRLEENILDLTKEVTFIIDKKE
jgi:hypothetical protein